MFDYLVRRFGCAARARIIIGPRNFITTRNQSASRSLTWHSKCLEDCQTVLQIDFFRKKFLHAIICDKETLLIHFVV